MALQSYQLVMKSGPTPDKAFPIDKDEVTIGRDVNSDIVINDPEISRRHARLRLQGDHYVLEDLGSTNGTFVEGQRLSAPRLLQPGEMIVFGENVTLVFEGRSFDPDATLVGSPSPAYTPPTEPMPETHLPPAAAEPPPYQAYAVPEPVRPPEPIRRAEPVRQPEPVYSGYVPPSPVESFTAPEEPKKRSNRTLLFAGCGCLVLLACLALVAVLWYIDANSLWCQLFPFLPGCP
jgi:predicted component of type VI protein secretion system